MFSDVNPGSLRFNSFLGRDAAVEKLGRGHSNSYTKFPTFVKEVQSLEISSPRLLVTLKASSDIKVVSQKMPP